MFNWNGAIKKINAFRELSEMFNGLSRQKYKSALFIALLIVTMIFHRFYEINQNHFRLLSCVNFAW